MAERQTKPQELPAIHRLLPMWLAFSVLSAGLIMFTYVVVQQNYRHGADDPQIQLAEDAATALEMGQPTVTVLPLGRVDIDTSLAPFVLVLNKSRQVQATNGYVLGGHVPTPPAGALQYADTHGRNRFTWEPQAGLREAAIAVPYHGLKSSGYVVVARSLDEVENREGQLMEMAGLALLAAIVVSGVAAFTVVQAVER